MLFIQIILYEIISKKLVGINAIGFVIEKKLVITKIVIKCGLLITCTIYENAIEIKLNEMCRESSIASTIASYH